MPKIALTNARIIDGTANAPIAPGTIIISGSVLESIGPADGVPVPPDCQVIDVANNTVLPGLSDGHMLVSGERGRLDHLGHLRTNLQAVGKLEKCLEWGTGAVGHAAGSPESVVLRELIESGHLPRCSDLIVGAAVTATCGHVRGRAADGPWEIRKAIREMVGAGTDFIKTCASGGFQWAHEELSHEDYTAEELQILAAEAHAKGKRVHVHAHAQPGLGNAIEAGCDVILHGAHVDEAALDGIAAKDLWYMPTLYITSAKAREGKNWPPHMTERMEEAEPIHRAGVAKAHKMGIKIVTGTDGGPGSIMDELCELVACGLSPLEAIVAATHRTADVLGILDKVGSLEAGKRADLLVVKGDPLSDISILTRQDSIVMVMKNGLIARRNRGAFAGGTDP